MELFASDFDGTLRIYDQGTARYRREDIDMIRVFQKQGGLFGICTGRPLFWMLDSLHEDIRLDFAVTCSGAVISQYDSVWHTLVSEAISPQAAVRICSDTYRKYKVTASGNDRMYVFDENRKVCREQVYAEDPQALLTSQITAISVFAGGVDEAQRLCAYLNETYGSDICAYQNIEYIDIVRAGSSKGTGMRKLKKMLGADRMAGIGDSFNDLPLLESCDMSFTFTDSPDSVKTKADYEVRSVAEALEIFMNRR